MALPTLSSVQPVAGPSSGGDLVRLVGTDLADRVRVLFGGVRAEAPSVRDEAGLRVQIRGPLPLMLPMLAAAVAIPTMLKFRGRHEAVAVESATTIGMIFALPAIAATPMALLAVPPAVPDTQVPCPCVSDVLALFA